MARTATDAARSEWMYRRTLLWLTVVQIVSGAILIADVLLEVPVRTGGTRTLADIVHFILEAFAVALLVVGLARARHALTHINRLHDVRVNEITSLRGEFDRVISERFDDWALSPAQRDVALLALRGLRIGEIARLRGCAEGTVKSHLNAVFRAAGVRSRAEIMAMFMDEFLDFGAEEGQRRTTAATSTGTSTSIA